MLSKTPFFSDRESVCVCLWGCVISNGDFLLMSMGRNVYILNQSFAPILFQVKWFKVF